MRCSPPSRRGSAAICRPSSVRSVRRSTTVPDPSDPGATALTRGETAGESLNDTIKAAAAAGSDIRVLARALQGEQRGDLAEALVAFADTTEPLPIAPMISVD